MSEAELGALTIRHTAAMRIVRHLERIEDRISLLAAVVWPQPHLAALSLERYHQRRCATRC